MDLTQILPLLRTVMGVLWLCQYGHTHLYPSYPDLVAPNHGIPVFAPAPAPGRLVVGAHPQAYLSSHAPTDPRLVVAAQPQAYLPDPSSVPGVVVTYDAPGGVPIKLLVTKFPPVLEAILQRLQSYFSTYTQPGAWPQDERPATTITPTTIPTTTTSTTTSTTTTSTTTSRPDISSQGRYRYDPPALASNFRYPPFISQHNY